MKACEDLSGSHIRLPRDNVLFREKKEDLSLLDKLSNEVYLIILTLTGLFPYQSGRMIR